MAATAAQPDMLFALAEMSYVFGRQAEKEEDPEACADYYLSRVTPIITCSTIRAPGASRVRGEPV